MQTLGVRVKAQGALVDFREFIAADTRYAVVVDLEAAPQASKRGRVGGLSPGDGVGMGRFGVPKSSGAMRVAIEAGYDCADRVQVLVAPERRCNAEGAAATAYLHLSAGGAQSK